MQSTRAGIVQGVCAVLVLASAIYLAPRLDLIELLAWGVFGMSILIGSLVEAYKDIDKWKKEQKHESRN